MSENLPEGLYESVLDRALEVRLDALVGLDQEVATVYPAEHTHVLARHLSEAVAQRLGAEKDPVRKLALRFRRSQSAIRGKAVQLGLKRPLQATRRGDGDELRAI